jgi:hypothetical protein
VTEPEVQATVPGQAPAPDPDRPSEGLRDYFRANRDRFTADALDDAARAAGYGDEMIAAAHAAIGRGDAATATKARARSAVLVAYLATYVVLVALMLYNDRTHYGQSVISSIVLTVFLGTALVISLDLIGRARAGGSVSLRGLIAVPLVLLVAVAGVCLWSGEPIPRGDDPRPLNRDLPASLGGVP